MERLIGSMLKEGKESLDKGELCFSMPKGKKGMKNQEFLLMPSWILLSDRKSVNFMLSKKTVIQSGDY